MSYKISKTPVELALDLKPPTFKGLRLSKKTISALEAIAYKGLSLHIAADRFGAEIVADFINNFTLYRGAEIYCESLSLSTS